ncbi:hydroxyacid oxidase 1 [Caerostris darwini]|uniref:Hydroxyacid oxidase 1 n=1 Tax=Caerostris darwini TaxID=1538125 RepID=A0AAV4UCB9_9ARAC|nr:hydroxyacid oxidase 1 [Caerostris darwini]
MLCLKDFEEYAEKTMDRKSWAFFSQGAERELTLRENLRAYTRYALIPRVLRSKSDRDLSTTLLGKKVSMPVGIAPTAYQRLAHPEGEVATARAANDIGVVYTLSSVSNTSIKDLANSRPNSSPLWMQLYLFKERRGALKIIKRAEEYGFKALVMTVDSPVIGLQLKLWKHGLELPPHLTVPNLDDALAEIQAGFIDTKSHSDNTFYLEDALSWEDVAWVKRVSKIHVILKGILTVEDALLAVKHGASAVWISNHGGDNWIALFMRNLQLFRNIVYHKIDMNTVPKNLNKLIIIGENKCCMFYELEVLPKIVAALKGTGCEVYVDGGVRWGSDVLKALALGARAVFIGRPTLWGLNHSGQDGVRSVLEILRSELKRAMHLTGCNTLSDIGPHLVQKREYAKI